MLTCVGEWGGGVAVISHYVYTWHVAGWAAWWCVCEHTCILKGGVVMLSTCTLSPLPQSCKPSSSAGPSEAAGSYSMPHYKQQKVGCLDSFTCMTV